MTDITRRGFIQKFSTAAVAASAFSILPSRADETVPDGIVKVALVGCGGRGNGALGQFKQAAGLLNLEVEVVALCDAFQDRLQGALNKHKVDPALGHVGFDAYKKAAESDAEFVLMATPPNFRPVHLDAMVDAGKHCFIEKPVGVDPVGVRQVIAAGERARAKGLAIVAGTQRRYQKGHLLNKARIDAGAIGQIVGGTVSWLGRVPWTRTRQPDWSNAEYLVRNWVNFNELSGDHIVEQHLHNLDVANWFIGRHPEVFIGSGGRARRPSGNQFDSFDVDLDYGEGVHIHSRCRQIKGCYNRVGEFFRGTEGQLDGGGRCTGKEVNVPEPKLEHGAGMVQEHVELIKGVRTGKPINAARAVAESTLTAVGGRIAAYTGQLVRWRDMMDNDKSLLYSLQLSPTPLDFERGEVTMPEEVAPYPGRLETPMMIRRWITCLLLAGLSASWVIAQEPPQFEDPVDYPLMGDWTGRWTNPKGWPDKPYPQLAAQVLPMEPGKYKVVFVTDLYRRAAPLAEFTVPSDGREIVIDQHGWKITFQPGKPARGTAKRGNRLAEFELRKADWAPPTLGAKPPTGARVLFDGSSLEQWQHNDGRAATWRIKDGAMETVAGGWNRGQNRKEGLGGNLHCKSKFGSLRYHMEFRYPVEQGAQGQGRGNSGLFFPPLPELQILNSYTTAGHYDEAGAMYRHLPPKVNAAGPPLAWQTYDVTITFTGQGSALVTADLNGHRIHTEVEIKTDATKVGLWLQDHNNRLQWRNIWVEELKKVSDEE